MTCVTLETKGTYKVQEQNLKHNVTDVQQDIFYILVRFIAWFYSIDAVPLSSPHCRTLGALIWTTIKLL